MSHGRRLFWLVTLATAFMGSVLVNLSANPEGGLTTAISSVFSYWVSLIFWLYLFYTITKMAIEKGVNSTGLFIIIMALLTILVGGLRSLIQSYSPFAQSANLWLARYLASYGVSVIVWGIVGGILNVWEWTRWPLTPADDSTDISNEAWTDIVGIAGKRPFYARVTRVWWFPHWIPVWGNGRTIWRSTVSDMMYVREISNYWVFSHRGFPDNALKVHTLEYGQTPASQGYRIVVIPLTVDKVL